jgi:hypothetical protein
MSKIRVNVGTIGHVDHGRRRISDLVVLALTRNSIEFEQTDFVIHLPEPMPDIKPVMQKVDSFGKRGKKGKSKRSWER